MGIERQSDLKTPKRLAEDNNSILDAKQIFFVGFSPANIENFIECFPQYIESIKGVYAVLDIDERTPIYSTVGEQIYQVKPLSEVRTINMENSVLIIMFEYENEAFTKLLAVQNGLRDVIYWFADRATSVELSYREKYNDCSTDDVIIFKSGSRKYVYGEEFSDNARALFEYMLDNGYNKKWKLVWIVTEPENDYYKDWKHLNNVEFIGTKDNLSEDLDKRERYYKYICKAKYAFATDDETFFIRRRNDQSLIQLWHGDGVKARTRHRRMEYRWDYMVCTSSFFANVDYRDFGLRQNQVISSGYPKDDWVFTSKIDISEISDTSRQYNHYILWAPTFRKSVKGLEILNENVKINETGLPLLATWEDCEALNNLLKEHNCLMIIKLHPVAELSLYSKQEFSNIRLMTNQDLHSLGLHINQIMPCFDAFITDYSSATASYMMLDRPMAFTLDDLQEYDDSRGFVLNPVVDYLPGAELYRVEDMLAFVTDVCNDKDATRDKRQKLIELMLDYRDGRNSERLLDMLDIRK
jgi:CDP-glycerol glycerophosphotransferase (TagB/SpsB family)